MKIEEAVKFLQEGQVTIDKNLKGEVMASKVNCWEYKNCTVQEDCPAYPSFGDICFSIEGTLCGGEVQGAYAQKIQRCRECNFYAKIMKEKEA